MHISYSILICVYFAMNVRLYVCLCKQCGTPPSCPPDSTYSPFTLLCPHPLLSLARLARTCMSVDSVLFLLSWHAPTSLQCSPVCINWQRDSGYVVCRAGRIERRERGEARGNVRTMMVVLMDKQCGMFTEVQTDKQTECVLLSVQKGEFLTMCCCVCLY